MSLISFTPLQDGVTGVNAAATNNPLNTIYNDYNGNITDANIATNAAIAGTKLNLTGSLAWQYLNSAKVTSNGTTQSTTQVLLTGGTVAVTVPSGYTQVRVSVSGGFLTSGANAKNLSWSLWRGTVGSGTQIAYSQATIGTSGYAAGSTALFALDTPGTGSVTYNIGFASDAGSETTTWTCSSTEPVTLIVESC